MSRPARRTLRGQAYNGVRVRTRSARRAGRQLARPGRRRSGELDIAMRDLQKRRRGTRDACLSSNSAPPEAGRLDRCFCLNAIATTSSSVRPTARASSTSCLCTGCNAVGPSGASVARPERARRGCRREAPHPRGSTSLSATLGSCNRLPLFASALAANGIPLAIGRALLSARSGSLAGGRAGTRRREETGAGPTWRPRGARCPGRPWTRATASFREGVPHR